MNEYALKLKKKRRQKETRGLYKGVVVNPVLMTVVYAILSGMMVGICVLGLYQHSFSALPFFLPIGFFGLSIVPMFIITVRNPRKHPILLKIFFCGKKGKQQLRRKYIKDQK